MTDCQGALVTTMAAANAVGVSEKPKCNTQHTAPEQELNISKKNDQIGRIELFENLLTNFYG